MPLELLPSGRVRRTPFWDAVVEDGLRKCSVYNRMLLPLQFASAEEDYWHLKTHVQVWDVSCQRQVELIGRDAGKLAQMMTPRYLGDMRENRCRYCPAVDQDGGMLNDPVVVKLSEERYWFSLADSDLMLWAKGLAVGAGLDVEVFEPEVFPLAIQGPKSDQLMERVVGPEVTKLGFFHLGFFEFLGMRHPIARSGWSKQGGFEIYVCGSAAAMPIWNALFEAGVDLHVRAGGPNPVERIEAGLLSYGSDMTSKNTPHECGLAGYCDLERAHACVGRDALLEAEKGWSREVRWLSVDGDPVPTCHSPWRAEADGEYAGQVTSANWSPGFTTNVALGMMESAHWAEGTRVAVATPDGVREATVHERPFI